MSAITGYAPSWFVVHIIDLVTIGGELLYPKRLYVSYGPYVVTVRDKYCIKVYFRLRNNTRNDDRFFLHSSAGETLVLEWPKVCSFLLHRRINWTLCECEFCHVTYDHGRSVTRLSQWVDDALVPCAQFTIFGDDDRHSKGRFTKHARLRRGNQHV